MTLKQLNTRQKDVFIDKFISLKIYTKGFIQHSTKASPVLTKNTITKQKVKKRRQILKQSDCFINGLVENFLIIFKKKLAVGSFIKIKNISFISTINNKLVFSSFITSGFKRSTPFSVVKKFLDRIKMNSNFIKHQKFNLIIYKKQNGLYKPKLLNHIFFFKIQIPTKGGFKCTCLSFCGFLSQIQFKSLFSNKYKSFKNKILTTIQKRKFVALKFIKQKMVLSSFKIPFVTLKLRFTNSKFLGLKKFKFKKKRNKRVLRKKNLNVYFLLR